MPSSSPLDPCTTPPLEPCPTPISQACVTACLSPLPPGLCWPRASPPYPPLPPPPHTPSLPGPPLPSPAPPHTYTPPGFCWTHASPLPQRRLPGLAAQHPGEQAPRKHSTKGSYTGRPGGRAHSRVRVGQGLHGAQPGCLPPAAPPCRLSRACATWACPARGLRGVTTWTAGGGHATRWRLASCTSLMRKHRRRPHPTHPLACTLPHDHDIALTYFPRSTA